MRSLLAKTLLVILSFQLAAGTAIAQVGSAVNGGQNVARSATKNWSTLNRLNPQYTQAELDIDTMAEADQYVESYVRQANEFESQCVDRKKDGAYIRWEDAFVLQENIPYADMKIKNCAQAHEHLGHMHAVATQLAEHFGAEEKYRNKNCASCGTENPDALAPAAKFLNETSEDFIPPGDKCSIGVQAKMAAEKCSVGDKAKNMLSFSCAGAIMKGIVLGLTDAIKGIGELLWKGVKWVGNKVADFGKWIWRGFKPAEKKSSQGVLALSQMQKKAAEEASKDKEGWLKRTSAAVWDFIKELIYVGMYERESKCMNCKEKSDLLCEIGGRIINDVVGFTMTAGFAYGAVKSLAPKVMGKLGDISARISAKFAVAAEKGGKLAKFKNAAFVASKKSVKWLGNLPIRFMGKLSEKTMKLWTKFKGSWAFKAVTEPRNGGKSIAALVKGAGNKVLNSTPSKVILWAPKKVVNIYAGNWQNRIFAKSAYAGSRTLGWATHAEAAALMQEMLPKLDKADVILDSRETRSPMLRKGALSGSAKDGSWKGVKATIDTGEEPIIARLDPKTKIRSWEVPEHYLTEERRAALARAKISIPAPDANGIIRLETPNSNFKKYFKNEYATPVDSKLGVPYSGKDKTVVIKYDNTIEQVPLKSLNKEKIAEFEEKGAVFTTLDHPNVKQVINPNKIDPKYFSKSLDDAGTMVAKYKNETYLFKSWEMTPEGIRKLEKDGYTFLEGGTTNKLSITEYDLAGKRPGQEIMNSAMAKQANMNPEERVAAQLTGVENLNVILTPRVEGAIDAQRALAKNTKLKPSTFEGMQDAYPIETFQTERGAFPGTENYTFETISGEAKTVTIPNTKHNAVQSIDIYQGDQKVLVRRADGTSEIYDVSKGKNKMVGSLDQSQSKRVADALGETRNGVPMDRAAIDDVIKNLEAQGKKLGDGYVIEEVAGQKTLRIKMNPECGKGTIDIPFLAK